MAGLIDPSYVTQYLSLSTPQLAALPTTIAAASRLVRNHTGRYLSARTTDRLITPPPRGKLILPDFPIIDVIRVSTTPRPVITITNADTATNQRATARMIRTGDGFDTDFAGTGVQLDRISRGVPTSNQVLFANLPGQTLTDLMNAVLALGGGWTATITPDYELWGVSELWSGQGAQGALSRGADFLAWTLDAPFRRDDAAGMLLIDSSDDDPFRSTRWGPLMDLEFGDDDIRGEYQGVRVNWTGGYAALPDDLADATVEVVKAMLERKRTSTTIAREKIEEWDVWTREVLHAIPQPAREVLAYYRDHAR